QTSMPGHNVGLGIDQDRAIESERFDAACQLLHVLGRVHPRIVGIRDEVIDAKRLDRELGYLRRGIHEGCPYCTCFYICQVIKIRSWDRAGSSAPPSPG